MNQYTFLCSLDNALREMNADTTVDRDYVKSLIPSASFGINQECVEEFEPMHETRVVYPSPVTVSRDYGVLRMRNAETQHPMRLLELEAVTNGTKVLTVGSDVALYTAEPSRKLQLLKSHLAWSKGCGCVGRERYSVTITGWWGYQERYAAGEAWWKADSLGADLDISSEALTLTSGADRVGYAGYAPRISPGMLIKAGSEVMRVYDVAEDDDKAVSIWRGERGTAKATHAAATDVYVWVWQPEAVRAAQRWTDLLFSRRGAFEITTITEAGGVIHHPGDMPEDVRNLLWRFLK